jgi:hypothetical protein
MTDTKQHTIFGGLIIVAVLFLSLGYIPFGQAADNGPYSIRDISVDETAATVPQAQEKAVSVGQRRAFNALMRRLVPSSYHDRLPQLDNESLTALVTSYQVGNERTSSQRYLADLSFEFDRNDIRNILRAKGLPFSEAVARPVLILPVFNDGEKRYLWEEPNPWRDVWVDIIDFGTRPQEPENVRDDWAQRLIQPLIVPAGGFSDIKAIDVEEAVAMDETAIAAIQKIYGTAGALVINAGFRNGPDGSLLLDITRQRSGQFSTAVIETYRGSDEPDQLMQSAIFDLIKKMQEDWKQQNVIDFSVENTLAVTTSISSLKDWLKLQEEVRGLPAVSGIKIKDLSVTEAFWHITFLGDLSHLQASLAQKKIQLVDNNGYWTLNPEPQN